MTLEYFISGAEKIYLEEPPFARRGEGSIHRTSNPGLVAKIYHSCAVERVPKIMVMIANPPRDPMRDRGYVSIAWPTAVLTDSAGRSVGFVMPFIKGCQTLLDVYHPKRRREKAIGVDWRHLHRMAMNLASVVKALHAMGYVIGDLNPENFLVNCRSVVTLIDADSLQVRDPSSGGVFHCRVWTDGFTPPELLRADFSRVIRNETHDRYGLGVLVHLLLFSHDPYFGGWKGSGEPLEHEELIRRGEWLGAPGTRLTTGKHTLPLEIVHPELRRCFHRCFTDGHVNPSLRPTPEEWRQALATASRSLVSCPRERTHVYPQHLSACCWCERSQLLQYDVFGPLPSRIPSPTPLTKPSSSNRTIPRPAPSPAPIPRPASPPPTPQSAPRAPRQMGMAPSPRVLAIALCAAFLIVCTAIYSFSTQRRGVIRPPSEGFSSKRIEHGASAATGLVQNPVVTTTQRIQQVSQIPAEPVRVQFLAYPWASVTVDGRRIAEETPVSITLAPGAHAVIFSHPKQGTLQETVDFEPNRREYIIKALFQEHSIIVNRH